MKEQIELLISRRKKDVQELETSLEKDSMPHQIMLIGVINILKVEISDLKSILANYSESSSNLS